MSRLKTFLEIKFFKKVFKIPLTFFWPYYTIKGTKRERMGSDTDVHW